MVTAQNVYSFATTANALKAPPPIGSEGLAAYLRNTIADYTAPEDWSLSRSFMGQTYYVSSKGAGYKWNGVVYPDENQVHAAIAAAAPAAASPTISAAPTAASLAPPVTPDPYTHAWVRNGKTFFGNETGLATTGYKYNGIVYPTEEAVNAAIDADAPKGAPSVQAAVAPLQARALGALDYLNPTTPEQLGTMNNQIMSQFAGTDAYLTKAAGEQQKSLEEELSNQQGLNVESLRANLAQRGLLDSGGLGGGIAEIGKETTRQLAKGTHDIQAQKFAQEATFLNSALDRNLEQRKLVSQQTMAAYDTIAKLGLSYDELSQNDRQYLSGLTFKDRGLAQDYDLTIKKLVEGGRESNLEEGLKKYGLDQQYDAAIKKLASDYGIAEIEAKSRMNAAIQTAKAQSDAGMWGGIGSLLGGALSFLGTKAGQGFLGFLVGGPVGAAVAIAAP